jgi:polysaccharide biosynthesis protein VpsJ
MNSLTHASPRRAIEIAGELLEHCQRADFAGFDPFDGLNSVVFSRLGGNCWPAARVAWLQLHKRSPLNLRSLLAVPKLRNPKGIALMVLGLLERYRCLRHEADLHIAIELGEWLLSQSVDRETWGHRAWGYHFDWAARAFYVPKGKPNAITTCYVARALHALGKMTHRSSFTEAAIDAGYFLDALYIKEAGAEYYAYIPGESAFVHNASLWAAALVAETATRTGNDAMLSRALSVARHSTSMQRADGAWLYGTRKHHCFIDGFHTGYNLEALDMLRTVTGVTEFDEAIHRGMIFFRQQFFLVDGTVKYYNDSVWPLDTHSVAQAIVTLLKTGDQAGDFTLADRVLDRALKTLYLPDKKRFVYQKGRWLTNRINYLRWTQAWAFYALSFYAANRCRSDVNLSIGKTLDTPSTVCRTDNCKINETI